MAFMRNSPFLALIGRTPDTAWGKVFVEPLRNLVHAEDIPWNGLLAYGTGYAWRGERGDKLGVEAF
jgi:hypothetical protein